MLSLLQNSTASYQVTVSTGQVAASELPVKLLGLVPVIAWYWHCVMSHWDIWKAERLISVPLQLKELVAGMETIVGGAETVRVATAEVPEPYVTVK